MEEKRSSEEDRDKEKVLGDKEEDLGDMEEDRDKEEDLGDKVEDLGDKEEGLGDKEEDLGDKEEGLGNKEEDLGDMEEVLGDKEEDLGDKEEDRDKEEVLGDKEEVLGDKEKVLGNFKVSYFAMRSLASFPWTFLEESLKRDKSSALISDVLHQTCLHPLSCRFPPSATYRKRFLTQLITRQEAAGSDPLDELYDALAEVVGAEDSTECYKTYILPDGDSVSLVESLAVISDGTTGLVTWESAFYLAEWALDHRQTFTGRRVLELGSGAGLAGIAVCRCCRPSSFVFSDVHQRVLQTLRDNVRLNGLDVEDGVRVDELDWSSASEELIRRISPDVVIAADVVYDPDVVRVLVDFLSLVLSCSSPDVFICSTVRNRDTYDGFKQQLGRAGMVFEVMSSVVGLVFPYSRSSDIEMIKLSRRH